MKSFALLCLICGVCHGTELRPKLALVGSELTGPAAAAVALAEV